MNLSKEVIGESGGLYRRDVAREYEAYPPTPPIPPGLFGGRLKSVTVTGEGGTGTDYDVDYYYETAGRFGRITGPGLPAYGAVYNYLTNSDRVSGGAQTQPLGGA